MDALVEIDHVDKHFGELHVLKDITTTVQRGEVVIVIGPSGSGKSTLCRTINRLETIDSGEIRIDGVPLPAEGRGLAKLRADVGMVFQSFNLFAHKTVLQNVTLGPIKVRACRAPTPRSGPWSCSTAWAWPTRPPNCQRSSRAGSSSASRSPALSRWSPSSCSSTSRPRRSTPR